MITLPARQFAWGHVGYTPSPEQLRAHLSPERLKLIAGGERAGKSLSAAMELFVNVIGVAGLWWICGPDYEQARAEFDYVLGALQRIGAVADVSQPKIGQCRIQTVFGGEIVTKTADDVRKLAGKAPDGVLLVEAAQTSWEVWVKLRGRVAEKRGWLWASGTFESGARWYQDLWRRWQADNPEGGRSFSIPTWANLAVFPGGLDNPEIKALKASMPADLFMERYGAVPCQPVGLVFREFSFEEHVREIVWRLNVHEFGKLTSHHGDALAAGMDWPIEIGVDPGYATAYSVVACTWLNDQVLVFDEIYAQGKVAEEVIAECKERWWWKKLKGGVIDIAGKQHPGSKSQQEIWRAHGVHLRANRVGIVEGILRLRTFLKDPETGAPRIFISPKCRGLLDEFGKYRYPREAEQRPISELPIDRDNHSIKALSYWLFDRYGPVARVNRRPRPGYNPFADSPAKREIIVLRKGVTGVRFGVQRQPGVLGLSFEREKP